jgi:hypothetical protein
VVIGPAWPTDNIRQKPEPRHQFARNQWWKLW